MSTVTSGKSKVGVGVIVGVGVMVGEGVIVGVSVWVGVLVCVAVGKGDGVNDGDGSCVLVAVKVIEVEGVGELSKGNWPSHPEMIVSARIKSRMEIILFDNKLAYLDIVDRTMNIQCLISISLESPYL